MPIGQDEHGTHRRIDILGRSVAQVVRFLEFDVTRLASFPEDPVLLLVRSQAASEPKTDNRPAVARMTTAFPLISVLPSKTNQPVPSGSDIR